MNKPQFTANLLSINLRLTFSLLLVTLARQYASAAADLSLQALVTPSSVILKDGRPVNFAIHGYVDFGSLAEAFSYIEAQSRRWNPDSLPAGVTQQALARELLRRAVESRIISMVDERPLELLVTHTSVELQKAIDAVKDPLPPGYAEAFLQVQKKWKHSLNCWSASPSIAARVLSNWYPIEEGIQLYGATYDSTEHFWQAVKYHPEVTVGQVLELLTLLQQQNWQPWLARLDHDPKLYLPNAYAIEFLRHNLTSERLRWFRDELSTHAIQPSDRIRQLQQRGTTPFRFTAFQEKVIWGDLADVLQMVYLFSADENPVRSAIAERHFDGIYLGDRKLGFISPEFRSLMIEIWKVKYLQMPRFREVIAAIPTETRLEHFLNDGDSPDVPIPVYVEYLNQIRAMAIQKSK